ncbi:TBC domain-containing protein kinase-like protein isoform X2 [Halichondria panicea]|uniref:TBC domain-containing protein kinase-like protein isoform X2 n=1 Tax=Halichondria panicea TaxID=6063 RepID=UPI00312B9FC3
MAAPLKTSQLAAFTFCARQHGADECDTKGLPLTPNTTNILGRAQYLLTLQHPHLAAYLHFKKTKNERVLLVTEWCDDCLENHVKSGRYSDPAHLSRLTNQILQALSYLNDIRLVHRDLSPSRILLTPEGEVKVHNYGMYYMTKLGKEVKFPIGSPRYMAPEVILTGPDTIHPSSPKVDVWSLGVILLELVMETPLYPDLFLRNGLNSFFKRLLLLKENYQRKSVHPLGALLKAHGAADKKLSSELYSFLEACLIPVSKQRSDARELLQHPFITRYNHPTNHMTEQIEYKFLSSPFTNLIRCSQLATPTMDHVNKPHPLPDHLTERPMREVYYLWNLAGGELEAELTKRGIIQTCPPVTILPRLVLNSGETFGSPLNRVALYDSTIIPLSLEQLRTRLETMTTQDYFPLEETESECKVEWSTLHESAKLPLTIRESDVEYQFHRVVVFSRLLEGYPYTRGRVMGESLVDVCPLYRGDIWAALLGIKGDIGRVYEAIDKDTATPTDRQIDVDIPRCHQYHPLLSSSEGHSKFRRILKSWVGSHARLVYWQGLDSLCAPFLSLNFNNEALAYSCLSAFIDKYLHKFFLRDNSAIMQEYLAVFNQLVAFHDPALFNHLDSIGFVPDLYAIPWFLTMFTRNSSFPLCVGVAILLQLRDDLLSFDFNECILMFSDLPDLDIQQCVFDAVRLYQLTPPSAVARLHDPAHSQPNNCLPEAACRQPLPLDVLRAESCPRISAQDLITLARLEPQTLGYSGNLTSDPIKDNPLMARGGARGTKKSRQRAVIIDIRPMDEFRAGHVIHSLNMPQDTAFLADGSLSPSQPGLGRVPRGRVLVVTGNKGDTGPVFARQLVRLAFPKVCVLDGGAGVLRTLGLLTSLNNDP